MGKGGRFLNKKAVPVKRGRKILLMIVLVFLLLLVGATASAVMYYNSMLNLITRPETVATEHSMSDEEFEAILGYVPEKAETETTVETTEVVTEPVEDRIINIMLIGQNYRKGEEHKLSDTLILCSLNKDTKTLTLTSFMRDIYLKLPNYKGHICGKNRINVPYNLGWYWENELAGMEMLNMTIQDNFGVEIDYNIEVGFETFIKIIDALGGVTLNLSADEARYITNDTENNNTVSAGVNHLDGDAALSYARIRHANGGDNDFNRTERQRNLVVQLLNQCKEKSLSELNQLLKTILPYIITDMTNEDITKFALELLPMLRELKIETNRCPADGTYTMGMVEIGGMDASVIHCDLEANSELLRKITEMPVT